MFSHEPPASARAKRGADLPARDEVGEGVDGGDVDQLEVGARAQALGAGQEGAAEAVLGGFAEAGVGGRDGADLAQQADFAEGFVMWRGLGVNYEFGVLDAPARVAIHFAHRLGAITAATVLLIVTVGYWRHSKSVAVRTASAAVWLALAVQLSLGLATVWFGLPLPVATAHNGVAALLLLTVINLNNVASRVPR